MALILIADDDRATRETLADLLAREGHETHSAGSAHELLDLAREHAAFDLVLTDVKMPRMDGIQMLELIRLRYPRARVIVMSAFSTPDAVVAAWRRGATDYLEKPFDWEDLQRAVGRALGAQSEDPGSDQQSTEAPVPETEAG
jgi:DNA-binding NtrC family response regulator